MVTVIRGVRVAMNCTVERKRKGEVVGRFFDLCAYQGKQAPPTDTVPRLSIVAHARALNMKPLRHRLPSIFVT